MSDGGSVSAGSTDEVADHRARPSVVVTLGTDHHPFARLVSWVDGWARDHPEVSCFIQHGTAPAPGHAAGAPMIGVDELRDLLGHAEVVVGHAGPGTIMDSLAHGRVPIIVARRANHGEVVDDHQVAFARFMEREGKAVVVDDQESLGRAIDAALAEGGSRVAALDTDGTAERTVRLIGELIDGMLM